MTGQIFWLGPDPEDEDDDGYDWEQEVSEWEDFDDDPYDDSGDPWGDD